MQRSLFDLAALDMDGTLLNSEHRTTPFTRDALLRASEAGKVIALCTGRCLSELREHLEVNPGVSYAICESGGCVYDVHAQKTLLQVVFDEETARRVMDLAEGYDALMQCFIGNQSYMRIDSPERLKRYHLYDFAGVFRSGSVYVSDMRGVLRRKGLPEKINLYFTTAEDKRRFGLQADRLDAFMVDSLAFGYEISPVGANKGRGLLALCDFLDIPIERVMAVGDGGNDLDLMRTAGFSVAMQNATDEIKAAADAFTLDCDHDGAAKAVLRWLMGEEK